MARIQGLIQEHALERSFEPTPSRFISGMSGISEGVPRMHPLKSSFPVFRASSLLHGLRIRTPRIGGMGLPRLGLPRL